MSVVVAEHQIGLMQEIDDDLPVIMASYPDGFTVAQLAEYYGESVTKVQKVVAGLILNGALTCQDANTKRFCAAETAKAPLGVPAGIISDLAGIKLDAILGQIKDACDVERIWHVKHDATYYVRSRRGPNFRKISDWWTAGEKPKPASAPQLLPPPKAPPMNSQDMRAKLASATAAPAPASPSTKPAPASVYVARTTTGLRDALFDMLDELRGPKPDIQKALAVAAVSKEIINVTRAELDFHTRLNKDKQLQSDFMSGRLALGTDLSGGSDAKA